MDLVIMAGGMGSRFGGLKQIESIDEFGNFIIDYSIFDAIKAGFDRVVFIIKKENYEVFKETIGRRVEKRIKTAYVFQELTDLPTGYELPKDRTKPWGTAHAIFATRGVVTGNFAIINADDFYGRDAFMQIGKFLLENKNSSEFALVGYKVKNTTTDNGAVKRGVVEMEGEHLAGLIECSIEKIADDKYLATPLEGGNAFEIGGEQAVSMNMFALRAGVFPKLEAEFPNFLTNNKDNILKAEFLIPSVISDLVQRGESSVRVLDTVAVWQGVTYKDDKPMVVQEIKKLVDAGDYPVGLWQ